MVHFAIHILHIKEIHVKAIVKIFSLVDQLDKDWSGSEDHQLSS